MLLGSRLCGGIKYEITGALFDPLNCHCSMCRKAQVAAFSIARAGANRRFPFSGRRKSADFL